MFQQYIKCQRCLALYNPLTQHLCNYQDRFLNTCNMCGRRFGNGEMHQCNIQQPWSVPNQPANPQPIISIPTVWTPPLTPDMLLNKIAELGAENALLKKKIEELEAKLPKLVDFPDVP